MLTAIKDFLTNQITGYEADLIIHIIELAIVAVCSVAGYYIVREILRIFQHIVAKTETTWDDDLFNNRFFRAVSQLAPALVVKWMLPGFFATTDGSIHWLSVLTSIYILATVIYIINILSTNLYVACSNRPRLAKFANKGILQMFNLIIMGIGVIISVSWIIGQSLTTIFTALGASAAVLTLVFKDTILGFVASIQLSANEMLDEGDWIAVDKHDANGVVEGISLTTIKVRNWDNSITTIPPYLLISESFRNYSEMSRLGARQVERAVYIDVNTVRMLAPADIEAINGSGMLGGYHLPADKPMVNLRLLRDYMEHYIGTHPDVHTNFTLMVRQLAPTNAGLPLQLLFYTRITDWVGFEHLQADIFDHLYAVVNAFGLSVFQRPAGTDVLTLDKK